MNITDSALEKLANEYVKQKAIKWGHDPEDFGLQNIFLVWKKDFIAGFRACQQVTKQIDNDGK